MKWGVSGVWVEVGLNGMCPFILYVGVKPVATTGELRAILQELHMIEIGDAASYLGEEALVVDESPANVQATAILVTANVHLTPCNCTSCQVVHA